MDRCAVHGLDLEVSELQVMVIITGYGKRLGKLA